MNPIESFLEQVKALYPIDVDLSLNRMKRLLCDLGNPEQSMPPAIHVAGTNGKGSTLAFLKHILEGKGKTCHVYTSPHLVHFEERICLNGVSFEKSTVIIQDALEYVLHMNQDKPITLFELITAAAFYLFSKYPADFVLIETGLGGRLDATNTLVHVAATAITSIGMDHTEFLGTELADIALEKAGILKTDVPLVMSSTLRQEASSVILTVAQALQCPVIEAKPLEKTYALGLKGNHQYANAGVAVSVAQTIGIIEDPHQCENALVLTKWPGRLHCLTAFPEGGTVWLDGAHNVDGVDCLMDALTQDVLKGKEKASKIIFYVHIKMRKDATAMLRQMATIADLIFLSTFDLDGGESFSYVDAKAVLSDNVCLYPLEAPQDLWQQINHRPFDHHIVTGSLFWVGHVLKMSSLKD